MRIGERTCDDGTLAEVRLSLAEGELSLHLGTALLGNAPVEALVAILDRYGKPLDGAIHAPTPALALGDGAHLGLLRHLARYDVIARDWLVLSRLGREPVAELAVSVLGALEHVMKAYRV